MLAKSDDKLAAATRAELAARHADQAMALLQQAVARGFWDAGRMKRDYARTALRMREDFQKLLAQLEAKTKQ